MNDTTTTRPAWERVTDHKGKLVYWRLPLGRNEWIAVGRESNGSTWRWMHRGPELESTRGGGTTTHTRRIKAHEGGFRSSVSARREAAAYVARLATAGRAALTDGTDT